MTAKVRIYGHPEQTSSGDYAQPLITEFEVTGQAHMSGNPQKGDGSVFFSMPVDYSGLDPAYPRAHQPHCWIVPTFNYDTRLGAYFSCPYGGRIEIEAV